MINFINNSIDYAIKILIVLSLYLATPFKTTLFIDIPNGSISSLITYYQKQGLNVNSFDKFIIYLLGMPQKGVIKINSHTISKFDFLYSITHFKSAVKSIDIIPGETSYFFLKHFSRTLKLDYFKLKEIFDKRQIFADATIIANTYNIPIYMKEKDLINYLINHSMQIHKRLSIKTFNNFNIKQWNKYLIIASIIQKEAGTEDEMPLVSSVIYNRLKKRMRLQMDGSLNYGKYSHTKVSTKRIKEDNTTFNTYKHRGLPDTSISSVSISAIKSALSPQDTEYLYFVRYKNSKKHIFSSSYSEHKKNIKKIKV